MSPHQTIAVGVRLFAVWIAVYASSVAVSYFVEGSWQFGLTIFTLAAIPVVVLWLFPNVIARGILRSAEADAPLPATADAWLAMGCALIGLWLLASEIPNLVRYWVTIYFADKALDDRKFYTVWLVYNAAQIAIAVWLILGAKGFRRVYWWAQSAGRK
jgi:hypothetical protein